MINPDGSLAWTSSEATGAERMLAVRQDIGRLACAADLTADLDGDGTTGVTDLLALLATWGPCG